MDIKEIVQMGGLIELTYPLMVFVKLRDFEELASDEDEAYGIFILGVGSTLKVETIDDNRVAGRIIEAAKVVLQAANTFHKFDGLGPVPFVTSINDLHVSLNKEV